MKNVYVPWNNIQGFFSNVNMN
ncbi:MAG: hypothetical protein FWK04_31560 [Nostoc sp. GBBB01]|nr:hypothetical protein [Nostoc sp. GBBB01]